MTLQKIIDKYGLKKYNNDDDFIGKLHYDMYVNETTTNNITTYYILDNQMSTDIDNGKTYFLLITKINRNKLKYDKKLGDYLPTQTTKTLVFDVE